MRKQSQTKHFPPFPLKKIPTNPTLYICYNTFLPHQSSNEIFKTYHSILRDDTRPSLYFGVTTINISPKGREAPLTLAKTKGKVYVGT
jgi:hypothetical protein